MSDDSNLTVWTALATILGHYFVSKILTCTKGVSHKIICAHVLSQHPVDRFFVVNLLMLLSIASGPNVVRVSVPTTTDNLAGRVASGAEHCEIGEQSACMVQ